MDKIFFSDGLEDEDVEVNTEIDVPLLEEAELRQPVRSLPNKKGPSPDNNCLRTRSFLECWKEQRLVPTIKSKGARTLRQPEMTREAFKTSLAKSYIGG